MFMLANRCGLTTSWKLPISTPHLARPVESIQTFVANPLCVKNHRRPIWPSGKRAIDALKSAGMFHVASL